MRKSKQWILFILCVGVFLALRMHSISKSSPPQSSELERPSLPQPTVMSDKHPWLQMQPFVKNADVEIQRDLEKVHTFSAQVDELSEEDVTYFLIEALISLQTQIPFHFPRDLYNVLCIPDTSSKGLAPYHIYQRLYLGESDLGLPFYLDVRVFELENISVEEVVNWHLSTLEGDVEQLCCEENHSVYILKGTRKPCQQDMTHGFAQLLGERGLFLHFLQKDNRLFVCYAEAPYQTFEKNLDFFRDLAAL